MARKVFVHRFTVRGNGSFPVDMLRYDSCHPERTEDAVAIAPDYGSPSYHKDIRNVNLVSYAEKQWNPTDGRWRSFGWKVLNHSVGHAIND